MWRAWGRGGGEMSSKWNLGKGGMEGGWQQVEGERLRTLWFGLNCAKKNVWTWIMQHFWPGLEIDARFLWCLDIIWVVCVWCGSCCSPSACLSVFSLDYQQCNWVSELRGPATAAQTCFCWNSSEVHRTTHAQSPCFQKNKTKHKKAEMRREM